jgi:hypothetical protein
VVRRADVTPDRTRCFVDHSSKRVIVPLDDARFVDAIVQEYVAADGLREPSRIVINTKHTDIGNGFIATPEQALLVAEALIRSARLALEG